MSQPSTETGIALGLLQRGPLGRMLRNPLMQRVIRNSGYLFTGSTLSAGMSMVQSILVARLLGPETFGILGVITVFASVVNRLTSFRIGELVVTYVGKYHAAHDRTRAAAIYKGAALAESVSSVVAFLLIVGLAPLAASTLVHDPQISNLFALYGAMVLAHAIVESSNGLLQHFDQFKLQAIVQVAQSALTMLLIIIAFAGGGGLTAIVLAYLAGKVVWAFAISYAALRQARRAWGVGWWRAPLSALAERRGELIRFGASTNITGTLTLVTRDSEVLWLGALTSPLQVGYYKVTLAIVNILLIPVQPLISTTFREVAREVATRSWDNVRYLLRSGSLIAGAYSVTVALGLAVFGSTVVSLWGVEFLPVAQQSLLILLVGITVINVFYWDRTVLLPLGLPEFPTKVTLVAAILKVAAILLLVPSLGANGMAITLTGYFLLTRGANVLKTVREVSTRARLPTVSS